MNLPMFRVNSEFNIKTILFLNREDNAGIECEDRHDGFYASSPETLGEFLDAYVNSRRDGFGYEDKEDPEQVQLMDDFIELVSDIYENGREYNSEDMKLIEKAIMTFGL
jgi:hypothetical protein